MRSVIRDPVAGGYRALKSTLVVAKGLEILQMARFAAFMLRLVVENENPFLRQTLLSPSQPE